MNISRIRNSKTRGFTLIEIMIATSISMILMFGALYSTSETLEVVREGDIRVNTNINSRRALDRLLKDCRYATEITVAGNSSSNLTVSLLTGGSLSPGEIEYTWNANNQVLRIGEVVGGSTNFTDLIADVRSFDVNTLTESGGGSPSAVITRIRFDLVIGLNDGFSSSTNAERTIELAGATWIRANN